LNLIRTGDIRRQAMLGEEDSLGQDAAENVKEDLKFELAVLNAAMKELNKNWDFTLLINPLLADQGPAMALVPKLKKQIDRMTRGSLRGSTGGQALRARGRAGGVAAAVPDRRGRGGGGLEGHEPGALERRAVQPRPLESPLRQPERSPAATNAGGGQNCGRMWAGGTCKKYISAGGYGCKEERPRTDFSSSMEDLRYKHRTDVAQMLPGE
jgi:hypothetical protein